MTDVRQDPRFQGWLAKVRAASQQEKDSELALAIDRAAHLQVETLIDEGASTKTANGIPFLAWAIRRTDDWQMTELLLDKGVSAQGVKFQDLWAFFEEDREKAYKLLGRIVDAGMEIDERAKAAIDALEHGDDGYVERSILRPGEDPLSVIDAGKDFDKNGVLQRLGSGDEGAKALYAQHFESGVTPEKLKEQVTPEGMTGFMLAVRAGRFDAASACLESKGVAPAVDDLTREDRYGASVITLMGHRQTLSGLFAPALWASRPDDALVVMDKVPERYQSQLDKPRLVRDIAQLRLSRQMKARPVAPPKG